MTLSIYIQLNSIEYHYAECRDYLNVMLSVIRLDVIRLNVIRLNVVMLIVAQKLAYIILTCRTLNFDCR